MRVAMVCPYSLSRPGGVQGQVTGLARALRAPRPRGGGAWRPAAPARPAPARRPFDGTHVVGAGGRGAVERLGGAGLALAGGGVAGRAASSAGTAPTSSTSTSRMAPVLGYGCLLGRPGPVGGHLPPLGRQRLVPGAAAAGRAGPAGGSTCAARLRGGPAHGRGGHGRHVSRCSSTGWRSSGSPAARPEPTDRPTVAVPRPPRGAQGPGRPARGLGRGARPGARCGWPATGRTPRRCGGRHPGSERVAWLGLLDDDEVARRAGRGRRAVCPVAAGRVVRHGAPRGAWPPAARWWPRTFPATGRRRPATPRWCRPATPRPWAAALAAAVADAAAGTGASAPGRLAAGRAHAEEWSMDRLARRYVDLYHRAGHARRPGAGETGTGNLGRL